MSNDRENFWRALQWVEIKRAPAWVGEDSRETGLRLYCAQADTTWNLQLRAPLRLANGKDGKDFMIATASVPKDVLIALRNAIDLQIAKYDEFRDPPDEQTRPALTEEQLDDLSNEGRIDPIAIHLAIAAGEDWPSLSDEERDAWYETAIAKLRSGEVAP
ncbi:MAG TPA: hypothetical protein VFD36_29395 [Kofleriaceae bacterium]|nr:hypothetical protein [Kofleriaceae bacterium]